MKKRLIICCDGTWNAPEINDPKRNRATNVLKLCRVIIPEPSAHEYQIVEYIAGVGTHDVMDRYLDSGAPVRRRVRTRFSIKPSPHLAARASRPVTSETAR